jgi:lipoprotein-anchoring transpeptidase ErfK/SrfK
MRSFPAGVEMHARMNVRASRRATFVALCGSIAAVPAASAATVHVSTFSADRSVVVGTRVHVAGTVAPTASTKILVQRSRPDGSWTLAATLRSAKDGSFDGMVPLAASGRLRAAVRRADGSVLAGRARSVAVKRMVTLSVAAPLYQEIVGAPFVVRGTIRPASVGDEVTVEGSRGGAFRPLSTLTVRRGGAFRGRVEVPGAGTWRFRVRAGATPAGQGAAAAVTPSTVVFAKNPHRVPKSAPNYIVQERSQFRLYYYEKGRLSRVFPVVFGAPGTPTPIGTYRVYSKTAGPSSAFGPLVLWYHRGYGIHGTNQEYLLSRTWRYYSHGCTRNYNDNIRWLWPRVPVGTPVVNLA